MIAFIKRSKHLIVAALTLVMVSGCSFTFVYNNLDWWANWYLDDYISLTKDQQQTFDDKFNQLHNWHRQTQLARYAEQLTLLKQQVNSGITPEQINEQLAGMRDHFYRLREHAKPDIIELVALLNQEQRQDLLDGIAENNRENEQEYELLSREDWVKQECISQQKQFRKWVGKLTKGQKAKLCEMSDNFQSTFKHWITYRKAWHQGFNDVLAPELDKTTYQALFAELISKPEQLRSEEYVTLQAQNNQAFADIFHYMMHNLTEKQKRRFNNRIDDYIEDFTGLIDD